jgi:hypothetical protein
MPRFVTATDPSATVGVKATVPKHEIPIGKWDF